MKRLILTLLASLLLPACGNDMQGAVRRVLPFPESQELVVLVPNGPTTFYLNAQGNYAGFEHDLVARFAAQNKLQLRFVVSNFNEIQGRLQRHEAHLAVGLMRENVAVPFAFGPDYQENEPVLLFQTERQKDDVDVLFREGRAMLSVLPHFSWAVPALRKQYPALNIEVVARDDGETLAERVARGEVDFALVDQHTAAIFQNAYPGLTVQDGFTEPGHLAWAVAGEELLLHDLVGKFFAGVQKEGTLAQLSDRYYGHLTRLGEPDTQAFLGRSETVLPQFKPWFEEAASQVALDWRLLAALAYQESHWDPDAVSDYGVRGIMMLTTDTASHLGVDRLNPYQSILGGARYIRDLKKRLPERIAEPDRTWLALAAYNVGMAHLEDARILAKRQKKNPDSWSDLKTTLPLLSKPEFYESLKFGYARGGEPVIFVESLRAYYDILVRRDNAPKPVLSQQAALTSVTTVSAAETQAELSWSSQARAY